MHGGLRVEQSTLWPRRHVAGGGQGSARTSATLAWGVALVAVGLTGLALVFQLLAGRWFSVANQLRDALGVAVALPFAWFGALIVTRRPGNRIGALLLTVAVSVAAAEFAQAYARYGVRKDPALPAFEWVTWLGNWTGSAQTAALVLLLLLLLFPDGRYRRGGPVERQQLKWLALATVLPVAAWVLYLLNWLGEWGNPIGALASWGVPVAIGIAVLRYHLYDIDRIIRRTIVYGSLTVLLGLSYVALVVALGQVLGQHRSSLVVAGATLVVAALFQPARRAIQNVVNRRFNRRRYDAAQTIEAFSIRLRQEIDLDTLAAEVLAVVNLTMEPSRASLWLRPPPQQSQS